MTVSITKTKCLIFALIFLFSACSEKQKENPTSEKVRPDTSSARGEIEGMDGSWNESENNAWGGQAVEDLELKIYPNPANDNFYLELNQLAGDMRYFIVSSQGPIVAYGDITNVKEHINISKLEEGVYAVKVISQYKRTPTVGKLVVQR